MKKLFKYLVSAYRIFRVRKSIKSKKASIEEIVKKKFNFLGSTQSKKGQRLYSFDPITEVVTEVPMVSQDGENIRAFISPEHTLTWALNLKNAKRKLNGSKSNKLVV